MSNNQETGKVLLTNVRLSFPAIFKKQSFNDGNPRFSANFILERGSANEKAVLAAIQDVAKAKWGDDADTVLKRLIAQDRVCLHDGNTKAHKYDGYKDKLFVSAASNDVRPTVIDRNRSPLTEEDGKPYSGCYVNASLSLWSQDNKYGQRVNASLRGVQFFADGDAFGGGSAAAADEFESYEGEAEDTATVGAAESLQGLI